MEKIFTSFLMGGLGNQLFQIVCVLALSFEYEKQYVFLFKLKLGNRNTYWNTFFKDLKPYLVTQLPDIQYIHKENYSHTYEKINLESVLSKNIIIDGYFQNEKFFKSYYGDIYKLLNIETKKNDVRQKVNIDVENYISLHFRLGDYKHLTEYHPLMDLEYYKKSLQYIIDKTSLKKVLYFCEEEDIEEVLLKIDDLKNTFRGIGFLRISRLMDWEELLLMSCCSHHIIANSSFSWWGAYLNNKEDKVVCYPKVWFGPSLYYLDISDVCPPEWIKI